MSRWNSPANKQWPFPHLLDSLLFISNSCYAQLVLWQLDMKECVDCRRNIGIVVWSLDLCISDFCSSQRLHLLHVIVVFYRHQVDYPDCGLGLSCCHRYSNHHCVHLQMQSQVSVCWKHRRVLVLALWADISLPDTMLTAPMFWKYLQKIVVHVCVKGARFNFHS